MIDRTQSAAAQAMAATDSLSGKSGKPEMDREPAWKGEFRRTLEEVREKGFGAYAEEINEKKLEELRQKILASMGLSETDLESMSPEQRNQIEKMVAQEMEKRLAAEDALDKDSGSLASAADGLADQVRSAPNGLGAGVLLMQEFDARTDPAREQEDSTR